jgi:ABC-type multidrug transport system fused ATPase/permease subunit
VKFVCFYIAFFFAIAIGLQSVDEDFSGVWLMVIRVAQVFSVAAFTGLTVALINKKFGRWIGVRPAEIEPLVPNLEPKEEHLRALDESHSALERQRASAETITEIAQKSRSDAAAALQVIRNVNRRVDQARARSDGAGA